MGGRREISIIFYRPVTRSDLKQERSFFRGSVSSFLQLVVAKARKSSLNANIGEFCSAIFVCMFAFSWRRKLLGYISNSGKCDYKVR